MPTPTSSKTKDIKQLVGQMFLVGFNGYSVPPEFRKAIAEYHLGGTIYFKPNVESPAQIAELSNEIQFSCRPKDAPPLFISIDHEGGKVDRLMKPFTKFPPQDHLGVLGSPKIGFEFGQVLAKELKAVGINIDFAPVVDVNSNPKNPIIGTRAFSGDPEVCGRMGSAVCRGLQKMGVLAVAKHFPGHGDTHEDSHLTLPKVERTLDQLNDLELIPFRRVIRSRVGGVMTAHILNPHLDPDYPATMSKPTIDLLRNDLRFSRILFSDDMEMNAVSENYGVEEAAVLAVKAGCDILIYRGVEKGFPVAAFEAIIKAVEKKEIPMDLIEKANARIREGKQQYAETRKPVDVTAVSKFIGLPEHFALADIIEKKELPPNFKEGDFDSRA
jgi:beta-N-acetylhexosaminidase